MSSNDNRKSRKPRPPVDVTELCRTVSEQMENLSALARQVQEIVNDHGRTKSRLEELEGLLPAVERGLRNGLDEVQDVLARRDFFPPKEVAYKQVVRRIREILRTIVPYGRKVAFVGKPDRHLLIMSGFSTLCFPQNRKGEYPGFYPANSLSAIAQLESIRARGADYLVFPETARWWLSHYQEFHRYLKDRFRLVVDEQDTCVIYALREQPLAGNPLVEIGAVFAEFESRNGCRPSVLDWNTSLDLARQFPHDAIFSPAIAEIPLSYLDGTVDIVVFSEGTPAQADEADRVASAALIMVANGENGFETSVRWKPSQGPSAQPSTSIIIACFNQIAHTEACLNALRETLPPDFNGEVIVVDDASTDDTAARLQAHAFGGLPLRVIRNKKNLGFIGSCNRAAEKASGEILVFLNNDTVPLPNWLLPLLSVFRDRPDAGAVGGKLIYPEGSLQEAGGLVFSDGSAANFGRDDQNTEHPLFNFLREVDYCSGALLATKRELFEKLGRFDERYKPAFYEDTDYCFRIREAGHRVYFQPESVVVHYEGATAGTNLSVGPKRYQVVNEKKFIQRWRSVLAEQPQRPREFDFAALHALALRPGSRPQSTVAGTALVCALMPEFDRDSGSRRVLHLVESLLDAGWAVTFVSHHANAKPRYIRTLQQKGVQVYCGDQEWMNSLIETRVYDLAVFGLWDIAEPYIAAIRSKSPHTRIIVDSIDIHFLRNSRRAFRDAKENGAFGLDSKYASEMVREINTYAAVDAVLTVSEKEAILVNDFVGETHLGHAVPDGEDLPPAGLPLSHRRGMVFVGCFRHTPNADAIAYLCKEIVPLLDQELLVRHPIYIVGDGLSDEIRLLGEGLQGVSMVGWVPAVEPYLRRARISVVPLRYGAGTKRKLLQALLHGTPTVCSSIGAEGLNVRDDEHVLIADDPVAFARAITILLESDSTWERIERSGSEFVRSSHEKLHATRRLNEVVATVLAKEVRNTGSSATNSVKDAARLGAEEYTQLVDAIRAAVEANLPSDAAVAVVSKGDNGLLELGSRRTWHFPRDEKGAYPGYHPASSAEAKAQMESLISIGANHILFPKTAFWWMQHYKDFKKYLDKHFHLTLHRDDLCSIYALRNGTGPVQPEEVVEIRSNPSTPGSPAATVELADTRLIAFFLPQYHPIKENDAWWGNGFTEWTNVSKARPQFPGHYQPRLPMDLGFYDLRLSEVRHTQAQLARSYGLHGFCYYHYWFSGKQLLERPFAEVLASREPDFPFCLCWANEPWSRRWDGRPRDILQPQHYSDEDDVAHIRWLIPALADPRAIKIGGKPVFIVYQGKDLPNPARTVETWRQEASKAGIGELYLMSLETGWDAGWDATRVGFDAKVLFQPQFALLFNSGADMRVSAGQSLRVFDYAKAWPALAKAEPVSYKRFDTVCVGWDNSARRGQDAVVLHGSSPEAYGSWLAHAISRVESDPTDERIVFINAWNEWGEGCYLEPDQRHGREFLEATKRTLLSR